MIYERSVEKGALLIRARVPSRDKIRELSQKEAVNLNDEELDGIESLFQQIINASNVVGSLTESTTDITELGKRDPGYRPTKNEDPYNSFIRKILAKGSGTGPLTGKKVGVKDNIAVRGVPMTNASDLCRDFVPDYDATVVTRLMEAGADIVGKMNMDNLSFSGTSETSIFGAVRNPINPGYSPGGSSSGSGAAVAAGQVDVAIGVDQGGSARVPACCCGVVSIKPTHGIVPTFGLAYMDHSLDHVCPIARSVEDVAITLSVIAGPDKNDPQWARWTLPGKMDYRKGMKDPLDEGLRIGVISESLLWGDTDPEIRESFLTTLEKLRALGFKISDVSIPLFKDSGAIWITLVVHTMHAMMESCGDGYWHGGRYSPQYNEHIGRAKKEMADLYPPLLKGSMIAGRYFREEYYSAFNSMSQNLRNKLRDEIDEALERFDLLVTPTMIVKPPRLKERITFSESLTRGVLLLNNTQAFNLTGHPAITVPCGVRGGFPVGLQIIGKHLDESKLFRAAFTFESKYEWKKL